MGGEIFQIAFLPHNRFSPIPTCFFALFEDMILDVVSKSFADVTLFELGTWTENVARVLIKILAGVDFYISTITNDLYRTKSNIEF